MKYLHILTSFWVALICTFLPTLAYAADPVPDGILGQENAVTNATILPQIFVHDLEVKLGAPGEVTGSFVLSNQDTAAIGGIDYEIVVLDIKEQAPAGQLVADTSPVYDRQFFDTSILLGAGEETEIEFTYQSPQYLPKKNYRLAIQAVTEQGHQLGWAEKDVFLGLSDNNSSFYPIVSGVIFVQSEDIETGEPKESWAPSEGVNVDPGQVMNLEAGIQYEPRESEVLQPTLSIQRILGGGESTEVSLEAFTTSGEGADVYAFPVTAESEPGAYRALLSFANASGQTSTIAEFRYVVRGVSASIVGVRVAALPGQAGNDAVFDVSIAGAADRVTELSGLRAQVDLTNDAGATIASGQESVVFEDVSAPATSRVAASLTEDVCGQQVQATVRVVDTQGTVLATSQIDNIQSISTDCRSDIASTFFVPKQWLYIGGAVIALAILVAIILAFVSRNKNGPTAPKAPIALIAFMGIAAVAALYAESQASGIQHHVRTGIWGSHATSIFVNTPAHESTVPSGSTVPYEARIVWYSCSNTVGWGDVSLYQLAGSGKVSWHAEGAWNQVLSQPLQAINRRAVSPPTHYSYTNYIYANIDLPDEELSPADSTTIWTYAVARYRNKYGFSTSQRHDYTWLNINHNECSDGVDNDGDIASDASDAGCWKDPTDPNTYDPNDPEEGDPPLPECSDGLDNDTDQVADSQDPGCWTDPTDPNTYDPNDPSEDDVLPECSDKIENDQDTLIDENDPGCWVVPGDPTTYNPNDPEEDDSVPNEVPECSDDQDNDSDSATDETDPGCWTDPTDPSTYDPNDPSEDDTGGNTPTPTPSATPTVNPSTTPGPGGNNQAPAAVISTQAVFLGEQITVSGAQSSDPDGTIASYAWTVRDPSGNPVSVGSSVQESFPGSLEGNYIITLVVTDDDGAQASVSTSVRAYNTPPVAAIQGAASNDQITLDGTGSYDPDAPKDSIASYSWTVTNTNTNSTVPVNGSSSATANFASEPDTTYEVRLTVADTKGKTDTAVQNVTTGSAGSNPTFSPGQVREVD